MSTESTLITSLVDLLAPVLLEKLEPQIDEYLQSKASDLRRQAMPELVRRKDFPEYTGYSCATFDRWAASGMPIIKKRNCQKRGSSCPAGGPDGLDQGYGDLKGGESRCKRI